MAQGGNFSFGRGFLSDRAFAADKRFFADLRRRRREVERERIAQLSDNDIVKIMGRVIAERATARAEVTRTDFHQNGVPDTRIDELRDRAFAAARRRLHTLDAIGAMP